MRTILVPLDGTPTADAALPHAVGLAARYHAELLLLTVCEASHAPHLSERTRLRWEHVAELGKRCHAATHMLSGNPAHEIVREAGATQADLIVMGTHGRAGLARWVKGSVAERVMRHAPCPVMVVRAPERTPEEVERPIAAAVAGVYPRYRHILLPLDGKPASEVGLGTALRLAGDDRGEVTLLRVLDFPNPPAFADTQVDQVRTDLDEHHRAYLEEQALGLRLQGCRVKTSFSHGSFGDRVAEQARDLVVLTANSHPLLGGGNIEHVVHRVDCPVLVLRAQGKLALV